MRIWLKIFLCLVSIKSIDINPKTPIKLRYDQVNYPDLLKFAALYNGLSWATVYGEILPAAPRYFWEKMPWDFVLAKRNGLFAQVLRVLEWETQK